VSVIIIIIIRELSTSFFYLAVTLRIFTAKGAEIMIERIRLGWHKPKLRGHLTNVTEKVNES